MKSAFLFIGITASVAIALVLIPESSTAQRAGQMISVQYGVVTSGRSVDLHSSAVPTGAVVGGTIGLVSASGKKGSKKARNTVIGAVAGSALAGASSRDHRGMLYDVQLTGNSGSIQIVTDQREIRIGDCVAVERARETGNIRRVSDSYCNPAHKEAVAAVADSSKQDAHECADAKQGLVDADTVEAAELAGVKVRLLCND
ncbi:MAG: hypothetical protein KGY53_04535 [Wenzhouxiangellaceae bacterium]|nr:hypothetical protein [Wenzhouxiangellaceae bacterium]